MTISVFIALIYSSVLHCNHIGISNHPIVCFFGNLKFKYEMYKTSTNEALHYHYKKNKVNYIQHFKKKWYTSLGIVFNKALVSLFLVSVVAIIIEYYQCILIDLQFYMFPRSVNVFL